METSIITSIFDSIPLWVMLAPIFICSILFAAVSIERSIFFRNNTLDYRSIVSDLFNNSESEQVQLLSTLDKKSGPVKDFIKECKSLTGSIGEIETKIKNSSEHSVRLVERYAGIVSTIATISPMFGLLGTVTGMMKSFSGLAESGPAAYNLLARGITEALVTTALGLLVAIPALIFYNYMVTKIDILVRDIEFIANAFFEKYNGEDN